MGDTRRGRERKGLAKELELLRREARREARYVQSPDGEPEPALFEVADD
jgi:hypothetical protein